MSHYIKCILSMSNASHCLVALACLAPTSALSESGSVAGQLCWAATSSLEFPRVRWWAGGVVDAADALVDATGFPGSAEPEGATATPGGFWSPAAQQSFCLPRSALHGSGGIGLKITFMLTLTFEMTWIRITVGRHSGTKHASKYVREPLHLFFQAFQLFPFPLRIHPKVFWHVIIFS